MTLQGLAAIYKKVHSKTNQNRQTVQLTNWIPSKIMRIYFQESAEDKLLVERLLNSSIVPYGLVAREKMAQLYYAFTTLEEYSVLLEFFCFFLHSLRVLLKFILFIPNILLS